MYDDISIVSQRTIKKRREREGEKFLEIRKIHRNVFLIVTKRTEAIFALVLNIHKALKDNVENNVINSRK